MANDPDGLNVKDAYVTVHIDPHHAPPFWFESTDLPIVPDNHIYFKFGKKDGFRVHFALDDPTYTFADKKSDALWVHNQPDCPSGACTWDGFKALRIEKGQTLIVHNKNDGITDFGYTLRVTNDGGKTYLNLDPIGSNQNSNSSNYSVATATVVTVFGAALGALAAKFGTSLTTQSPVLTGAVVGGVIALVSYLVSLGSMRGA